MVSVGSTFIREMRVDETHHCRILPITIFHISHGKHLHQTKSYQNAPLWIATTESLAAVDDIAFFPLKEIIMLEAIFLFLFIMIIRVVKVIKARFMQFS